MGTKVTSSSGSVLEEPEIQKLQMQAKIFKENSLNKLNALKSTTQLLENQSIWYQQAFARLFGDSFRTFKFQLSQHMNNLETLLNAETLHEMDSKSALSVIKVQFERFINSDLLKPLDIYSRSFSSDREVMKIFRDYTKMTAQTFKETIIQNMNSIEQCIIERASHEQELKMTLKKLSERQLQIQQCKVQEVQSSVTSSGDETSSGIVSDEEIDKQKLEAHYGFMAKIHDVLPAESSSTDTPLEQVQNNDEKNMFANERQHSEKHAAECADERAALANLIANLTLDTEENKTILKQLKKANASLTQELEKCKTNLDETNSALGEAISCRDSCLIALQNKQNEFEKYKAFNDRTIDYEILQTKLNETLGLLAHDNQSRQFGNQRTMTVAGARETVGSQEKMMMCKQAEQGVPLQAEQADWLEDTDEEIDEQELEAHYSYMAKIQEVSPEESSSTGQPLEQVQNHDENDVFANVRRHSEQPKSINDTYVLEKDDSNVIPDSSNICTNDNQVDQNDAECVDERAALANLIANFCSDKAKQLLKTWPNLPSSKSLIKWTRFSPLAQTRLDSAPAAGSIVDIPHIHACKQSLVKCRPPPQSCSSRQKAHEYDTLTPVPPRTKCVSFSRKAEFAQQGLEFLFSPLLEEYYNPTHGLAEENNNDQAPNASFQEAEFINPFCTRKSQVQELVIFPTTTLIIPMCISFQPQVMIYRWNAIHPLEQVEKSNHSQFKQDDSLPQILKCDNFIMFEQLKVWNSSTNHLARWGDFDRIFAASARLELLGFSLPTAAHKSFPSIRWRENGILNGPLKKRLTLPQNRRLVSWDSKKQNCTANVFTAEASTWRYLQVVSSKWMRTQRQDYELTTTKYREL
ncbi:hypothetical protein Tco_1252752 [Tanacetum coccineum]